METAVSNTMDLKNHGIHSEIQLRFSQQNTKRSSNIGLFGTDVKKPDIQTE